MSSLKNLSMALFNLLLILSLLFPHVSKAEWIDFDGASNAQEALDKILSDSNQESIFSAIEKRYGFDKDIWRKAKRKVSAPRVEIFFDNTNPKPGEKVTAHAVPEYFKNDSQNLYYTWYLIHTKDGSIQTATNNLNSGIREASKIMSRGDYDPDLDGQDYKNKDTDPDKDGWPAVDANSYSACLKNSKESANDCAFAPYGGADGLGGLNDELRAISDEELSGNTTSVNEEIYSDVSRCYKHKFGTNYNPTGFGTDDSSGLDYPIRCDHKWMDAPSYASGSGKFSNGEEEYWKTDPLDPDTDDDGFPDEADIIGLGQENFTWTYQTGDRVGVVVEGTSMIPTDEKNAYYKIMWGYPDVCDATKTQLMDDDKCDDSGDYGFGFYATKSPSEEKGEGLKVSLSFSPDNPQANLSNANKDNIKEDGSIFDADQITVLSSIDNTTINLQSLYYTWQISKGDPKKDNWREMNIKDNFDIESAVSGLGITQINFTPKTNALSGNDDVVYFKVTLTVSKASNIESGRGRSSVVIPVNKNGIRISLHKVEIRDGKAAAGEEVCNDGLYVSLCPAVKYQMLAAKISGNKYNSSNSDFTWQINGNILNQPKDWSLTFDEWGKTTVFFPITKEEQEIEEISVVALPKDSPQPVNESRFITVVKPAAFIKSADLGTAWPSTYITEDNQKRGSYVKIESSKMFNTPSDSKASFFLDFVPYYLLGNDSNTSIDWMINGTSVFSPELYENNPDLGLVNLENNDRSIIIPTSTLEGVYTDLSVTVQKYWSDEEKNILASAWGIYPQTLSSENSITFATTLQTDKDESAFNRKQILAAIGTHIPHYFMYLLRLVLTMGVMIYASAFLYGMTRRISL